MSHDPMAGEPAYLWAREKPVNRIDPTCKLIPYVMTFLKQTQMRIRFPNATFVIFSLFVISVGCCLLVPLIWNDANLSYFRTIHSYSRRSQISGFKLHFNVDQATKIEVRPEINAQNSFTEKIIIEDPGKIKLAKQFIQDHADGWLKRKDLDLLPLPIATIVLYDSNNRKLDEFAIGRGNVLLESERSTIDTYWKYVEDDQLSFFIEVLDLSDKVLGFPKN